MIGWDNIGLGIGISNLILPAAKAVFLNNKKLATEILYKPINFEQNFVKS